MHEVRVKLRRGAMTSWVVGASRSRAVAQRWAAGLAEALSRAFPGERDAEANLRVRVVRVVRKSKAPGKARLSRGSTLGDLGAAIDRAKSKKGGAR